MDMPHMRSLYQIGRISNVMAIPNNKDGSWHVDCCDLWGHVLHLTTASGEVCRFPSLESASEAAHDIGFQVVQVVEH
ncbi:hypothetical protein [Pseudomaricurvus sp. HS19]|uniref:hypothetical protein n=1 Tax=Pseudomaricurvus sp. HS19 TaxID=2692626 RepID=UPI001371E834|nr:hypothetical protein [Pseudomaricurvus sp. HS19]MYM63320.1 hypothetical protein [Pseudomaricurvus sp. HS19]